MYSIIIPIYNEQETVPELLRRLTAVLNGLDRPAEVLFIDDGSGDASFSLLADAHRSDPRFKVIRLSRNFGHQVAISAGIDYAAGEAIMIMDGDLQDPPELLPEFLAKWKEGHDVVFAVRRKRKEGLLKKLAYFTFYRLLQRVAAIDIPLDSGDFSLIDRRVADVLRSMPERRRFVRGIRSWAGFKQVGVEYERDRRFAGEAKYTPSKLSRLALDGIFSFSFAPLRLASYTGFTISVISFALALFYLLQKIFVGIDTKGWASTIVIILFLGGVQLLTIGIIGEYIGRVYDEVKQRPLYVVSDRLGFEQNGKPLR
jgi:glycosyltransferase involved in cell wall biosynthesis